MVSASKIVKKWLFLKHFGTQTRFLSTFFQLIKLLLFFLFLFSSPFMSSLQGLHASEVVWVGGSGYFLQGPYVWSSSGGPALEVSPLIFLNLSIFSIFPSILSIFLFYFFPFSLWKQKKESCIRELSIPIFTP